MSNATKRRKAAAAPPKLVPDIKFDINAECCASCKFFRTELPAPIAGWCVESPPRQFEFTGDSRFPPVGGQTYCGRYQRKTDS